MRRLLPLFSLVLAAFAARAGGASSSESFVFLEPEKSSFWRTVTNDVVTIPIVYPAGAAKATLYVEGLGHSTAYADLTGDSVTVTLPAVTSTEAEDVYLFTLAFDSGVTNSLPIGHIRGYGTDGEGTTRLRLPRGAQRRWQGADGRSVLPIPYGATALALDEADPVALDGAQGWYALPAPETGESRNLRLTVGEDVWFATLVGGRTLGATLMLR